MARDVQRFEVSLKAFIVDGGRALFVREADSGYWELPGGRIDVGEEWEPHATVLAREIREELGTHLSLRVGSEAVTWTRRRPSDGAFLFIIARPSVIVTGGPLLSPEHAEMAWLGPDAWETLNFPPDSGYHRGVRELWRLVR
ncbi:MAG: NUDIX domain-containing protein [Hyphomicrobiaceae bacterium]|nr:NUDIX domain-containing protein [Hyphomicrobiaceae bacterium]